MAVWSGHPGAVEAAGRDEWTVGRIMLPEQFATTFERLENNVALLLLVHRRPSAPTDAPIGRSSPTGGPPGLRAWPVRNLARTADELFPGQRKRTPTSICLSSIIDRTPDTSVSSCYAVSFRKTNLSHATSFIQLAPVLSFSVFSTWFPGGDTLQSQFPDCKTSNGSLGASVDASWTHAGHTNCNSRTGAVAPQPAATGSTDTGANNLLPNDGTNYVTTNISIFPATECRPEHREYLQHDGNLCAGYGAAKNRSIDVDFSGSPLICDKLQED
uniref:Uncharacterized protein n=1 Tax=Anopheles maculatus TaxID=74869 RepID=A0A182SKY0_9DIPT